MTKKSDARAYWEDRLSGGPTLATVGWLGLSPTFNRWMYRVRAHVFISRVKAVLKDRGRDPAAMNVLDVGSGSGFYIDLWKKLGVREISGCDLTSASVNALSARYPDLSFTQADFSSESLPFARGSFDAISCMDVLFHIVDDSGYVQALKNCAALLRPGGLFIFTDNCLHADQIRAERQVSRALPFIERALADANLRVLERKPVFVLMNTPVDSQNRALIRLWHALAPARRYSAPGYISGMTLYPFELVLTSLLREGPSTEMLVCAVN